MTVPSVEDWIRCNDRRGFLLAATSFAFTSFIGKPVTGWVRRNPQFPSDPFRLGVASGDPAADGFVLWTRLAPDPVNGGGMPQENVEVRWELAEDDQMKQIVRHGTVVATPELGHSVHVEIEGLRPDRWYFYRFQSGDAISPLGRTRTTPRSATRPDRLRFAFASCQHFETGYYNAYRHMNEDDLDLVIHLGDYIYEGGVSTEADRVRRHNGPEIQTLGDYRNRYGLYKSDADLQAAHAGCPWLVTWDDHEFDNNYSGEISEEPHVQTAEFLVRRAQAYQAYYEHMPLRRSSIPAGPHMQLYRSVPFGTLAQFDVLDTRQYRTDQPCGDRVTTPCDEVFSQQATLLGDVQEQWLKSTLQKSPCIWNVLAQQIMMARVDRDPSDAIAWSTDKWAGYDVARKRLIRFLSEALISNPIVLTGDIHSNWVNDLKVDFDSEQDETVATEFVGTSISSGGNGSETRPDTHAVLRDNPFVKFFNNERGYVRCTVSPELWRSDYRVVDTVTSHDSTCITRASWAVEAGHAAAEKA